jgi:formylglycine-generating enzyme
MRFSLVLAGVSLLGASAALAHVPPRAEQFSAGLDATGESARASGVVLLRAPARGRVSLPSATFKMGSDLLDMWAAKSLCEREPLGKLFTSTGTPFCHERQFMRERNVHLVTLAAFAIDRTEVPVEAYARCVESGSCASPGFRAGDRRFDRPDYPVTSVLWEDAVSYCLWAGGRIPTEAVWESAARGAERRTFPWGNVYNDHLCNHGSLAEDSTDGSDGFLGLAPVGSFPDGATPTGIYDLAGNVEEWVADPVELETINGNPREVPYEATPVTNPFRWLARGEPNPAPPDAGSSLMTVGHYARGGSYRSGAHTMRAGGRRQLTLGSIEADGGAGMGFRCVYETL